MIFAINPIEAFVFLIALSIFMMWVLYSFFLGIVKRATAALRGGCYRHTPGKLLDVASVGNGAKHECAKCGEVFWSGRR